MEDLYQKRFDLFRETISQWHQAHRTTSPGTTFRLKKRFENYEYLYHKYMAEYKKNKQKKKLDTALKIVDTAEKEFKLYSRLELLSTLSK